MSKVKEAMFSMLGPEGVHEARILDIYAGTGALGIEALRRGASEANFVEKSARLCSYISTALEKRGLGISSTVYCGEAISVLKHLQGSYKVIFADPPYGVNPFAHLMEEMKRLSLLAEGCTVFMEHDEGLVLPETLAGVGMRTRKVYGDTAVTVYVYKIGESA